MKPYLKYWLYRLRLAPLLNRLLYLTARRVNRAANRRFRGEFPCENLPPDYFLYETYRLDYRRFTEHGRMAAAEIHDWTRDCFTARPQHILDWGCGVGRITQHLPGVFPGAAITGIDTNEAMITWDAMHIPGITFSVCPHHPPTGLASASFDLVIGWSVLTHIDAAGQEAWLREIARILAPGGIAVFTTHGRRYRNRLTRKEQRQWLKEGLFTQSYPAKGHRMLATYHEPGYFRDRLSVFFTILAFTDGSIDDSRTGGQDLWIVQRPR